MWVELQRPMVIHKTGEYFKDNDGEGTFIPDDYKDILPSDAVVMDGPPQGQKDRFENGQLSNVDLLAIQGKEVGEKKNPKGMPAQA